MTALSPYSNGAVQIRVGLELADKRVVWADVPWTPQTWNEGTKNGTTDPTNRNEGTKNRNDGTKSRNEGTFTQTSAFLKHAFREVTCGFCKGTVPGAPLSPPQAP